MALKAAEIDGSDRASGESASTKGYGDDKREAE